MFQNESRYNVRLKGPLFPKCYQDAVLAWENSIPRLNVDHVHGKLDSGVFGPMGEPLYSHYIYIGSKDADHVLIVLSGTHGIEGPAGSAIQLDLIDAFIGNEITIAQNLAVLIVHALNPWGYAWHRRCDNRGIDLNRNFINFEKPPLNPGYMEIRESLFCSDSEKRNRELAQYAEQYGNTAMEIAVSGGQYEDPMGPFYGGTSPTHGQTTILQLIDTFQLDRRKQLAVIDCHTGLGPYGYGEIICDHPAQSKSTATAQKWYGKGLTLPDMGTSSSVPKSGLLDYAWHRIMNDQSCFVTLEFGTLGTPSLFDALATDHLVWKDGQPKESLRRKQAQVMKDHFIPQDDAWKNSVLFRGRQVLALAFQGLSS